MNILLDCPALLAPGMQVIKTWNRPVLPDDDPADEFTSLGVVLERMEDDEAGERWRCWFADERIWVDIGSAPDIPLWHNDAPCLPAIDALVRAAEAADTRWGVRRCDHMDYSLDYPWGACMDGATVQRFRYEGDAKRGVVQLKADFWDRLRRLATDYAGVLALANEAAPLLKGRVETP